MQPTIEWCPNTISSHRVIQYGASREYTTSTQYQYLYNDDGSEVSGVKFVASLKYFGGLSLEADHRNSIGETVLCDHRHEYPLDAIMCSHTEWGISIEKNLVYAYIPFNDLLNIDAGVRLSPSLHVLFGGHFEISYSFTENLRRIFS